MQSGKKLKPIFRNDEGLFSRTQASIFRATIYARAFSRLHFNNGTFVTYKLLNSEIDILPNIKLQ